MKSPPTRKISMDHPKVSLLKSWSLVPMKIFFAGVVGVFLAFVVSSQAQAGCEHFLGRSNIRMMDIDHGGTVRTRPVSIVSALHNRAEIEVSIGDLVWVSTGTINSFYSVMKHKGKNAKLSGRCVGEVLKLHFTATSIHGNSIAYSGYAMMLSKPRIPN